MIERVLLLVPVGLENTWRFISLLGEMFSEVMTINEEFIR